MGLMMLILIGIIPGRLRRRTWPRWGPMLLEQRPDGTDNRSFRNHHPAGQAGTTLPEDEASGELTAYIKPTAGKATEKTFAAVVTESQVGPDQARQHGHDLQRRCRATDRLWRCAPIFISSTTRWIKFGKKKLITDPAGSESAASGTKKRPRQDRALYPHRREVRGRLIALGFGTMIGWKRIVVTVGEKIGKSHLTYAQGASAELMAAATIGLADFGGLPVSTTHVLSSGIAGTMAANRSGLQTQTLVNIVLAWVLTLPVCVFLGATLFSAGLYVTFHVFGIK